MIEGTVGRDTKQPRAERDPLERRDRAPCGEESVLYYVLRIGRRADDAQSVTIERSLLSSCKILERSRVAAACALDEELDFAICDPSSALYSLLDVSIRLSHAVRVEEKKKKGSRHGEDAKRSLYCARRHQRRAGTRRGRPDARWSRTCARSKTTYSSSTYDARSSGMSLRPRPRNAGIR